MLILTSITVATLVTKAINGSSRIQMLTVTTNARFVGAVTANITVTVTTVSCHPMVAGHWQTLNLAMVRLRLTKPLIILV